MWKFGIYADRDSIFVGGKPGRWIGLHVDLPWSEDCKEYGAPYRVYLHWWPGKCRSISLSRFFGEPPDLFGDPSGWTRITRGIRRCSVEGCEHEGDDIVDFMVLKKSVHHRGGGDTGQGSIHSMICPTHVQAAEKLRIRLTDPT